MHELKSRRARSSGRVWILEWATNLSEIPSEGTRNYVGLAGTVFGCENTWVLNGSDLPYAGKVMWPVDNGKWGEFVKPRCFSRLSSGRMKNMNRLTRIYGLKCRHCLHELIGSITLWTCMQTAWMNAIAQLCIHGAITLQNDKGKDCDRHPPHCVWVQMDKPGKVYIEC